VTRQGLRDQPIQAIARHEGSLLVVTDDGVMGLERDQTAFRLADLPLSNVRNIHSTPQGLLVARQRQLDLWSGGKTTRLHPTLFDISSAMPSRVLPETFLAVEYRSVVRVSRGNAPSVLAADLPAIPLSLAEDPRGRVWAATKARGCM
jgi:hypothetical protein